MTRDLEKLLPLLTPHQYDNLDVLASIEIEVNNHPWDKKWKNLLDRLELDAPVLDRHSDHPKVKAYLRYLDKRVDGSNFQKCLDVTGFINQLVRYKPDPEAYEEKDYWATPAEFLMSQGDCEDYCIIKFLTLLEFGVPSDALRIVIVKDNKREIIHAVVAFTDDDGSRYLLDNLYLHLAPEEYMLKYEPIYSFSLKSQWVHLVTPKMRLALIEKEMS